ncbi:MAG: glycosyltransferase [Actinomycetota bacterium]
MGNICLPPRQEGVPLAVSRLRNEIIAYRPIRRVAMLVVHSNPLSEPGQGDAGGMTVYVRELAWSLAARGVQVDIYTRAEALEAPEECHLPRGITDGRAPEEISEHRLPPVRVIRIPAGPSLPKERLPAFLPELTANMARWAEAKAVSYDLIHSHYWLSGRVASVLARRWGIPFVHTFHTLGRAKNARLRRGDVPEPDGRLTGESRVIAEADAIVASAPEERDWLIDLYAAHPERIHLIPPGVDHTTFRPADVEAARVSLGLAGKRLLLFVGRLQPLKGADTALRTLAHLLEWGRLDPRRTRLLMIGGPSGPAGGREPERLAKLVAELSLGDAVTFLPAQPHRELPLFYQASEVCLVPSYTESFGLVALEAQACGVPVVGSAVGGLRAIVRHGRTGFLVEPGASEAFAERTWRIMGDPGLAASMSRLAICSSGEFSWERCASDLYELYAITRETFREEIPVTNPPETHLRTGRLLFPPS